MTDTHRPATGKPDIWPDLPYLEWVETRESLHRLTQIAGKLRVKLSPFKPQWLGTPLYVDARGLTTGPVPWGTTAFEMRFDLIEHAVVIESSTGVVRRIPLVPPRCVADVWTEVMSALRGLGVEVELWKKPQEVADETPLDEDRVHCSYDPGAVNRFFRVLTAVNNVFDEYRSPFFAKSSLQFWWGSFDLSVGRFCGKACEPPEGAGYIFRIDLDAEHVASGFWPGDEKFPEPAFYSYTYPAPPGYEKVVVRPAAAYWDKKLGEFILRYKDVRAAADPRQAILDFLESTYQAGGGALGFDPGLVRPDPQGPPPNA
jgi:hypothetical protein